MTSTSLLLLALAFPQAPSVLPATDPVFVEITAGRGTLLAGESTAELSAKDGEQWVEGRGHISLMASATAVLRWHERASLTLCGPCEFEWEACAPEETLEWNFQSLTRAEIESRRSELRIVLGGTWSMWMPPGALQIRGLPGYEYEIMQQAGSLATYQWEGVHERTRPVRVGVIGSPVRLGSEPLPSRVDHSSKLDGRPNWNWPWRQQSDGVATWGYRDWPWIAGPPRHVTVRVVPPHEPEPTHRSDPLVFVEAPAEPTADTEPTDELVVVDAPLTAPTESPSETTPLEPESTHKGDGTWGWESDGSGAAGPWRGLDKESYEPFGDYFIQTGKGILSEVLPDGGVRFWVPEHLKTGGWVLGPRLDSRLDPGGSIEFGPTGALRAHSGGVRVLAALER